MTEKGYPGPRAPDAGTIVKSCLYLQLENKYFQAMKFLVPTYTALLYLFAAAAPLSAQTVLKDPMIPDGETASYTVREGEAKYTFTEEVFAIEEKERSIYGFIYKAEGETVEVRVERPGMIPVSVRSVYSGNGISIESSTSLSFDRRYRPEGVPVLSFTDLKYVLRGYPFGEIREDLDIEFIDTGGEDDETAGDFAITVRYIDLEEMNVTGRTIACHKIELQVSGSGIMRVLKPFIPRTYFWYSADPPHYLVAYEGSSSFPGSPKRHVEILEYSGWN